MPIVAYTDSNQDATLYGLAKKMAHAMETGAAPMKTAFQNSSGRILFQKLGDVVRALVTVKQEIIVGYIGSGGSGEGCAWFDGRFQYLPYQLDLPRAISSDGSTIIGESNLNGHRYSVNKSDDRLYRGSRLVTLSKLHDLPPYMAHYVHPRALSADGRVIVGEAYVQQPGVAITTGLHAAIWNDGVLSILRTPMDPQNPTIMLQSHATGVSADGRTVCGEYFDTYFLNENNPYWGTTRPCIWRDGVFEMLDIEGSESSYYKVYGISADGTTISGAEQKGDPMYWWTDFRDRPRMWILKEGGSAVLESYPWADILSSDGASYAGSGHWSWYNGESGSWDPWVRTKNGLTRLPDPPDLAMRGGYWRNARMAGSSDLGVLAAGGQSNAGAAAAVRWKRGKATLLPSPPANYIYVTGVSGYSGLPPDF